MTVLRSTAFNLGFYLLTLGLMIVGLPALVLPHRAIEWLGKLWSGGTLWLLRATVGLDVEVRGREHMARSGAIYAFKHQSALETIVLPWLLPDLAAVLKRELTWIPLFGLFLAKFGVVAVDRGKGGAALRGMLRRARRFAEQGRPLIVAPEGTRRPPGAEPRYLPGVAALYTGLGLPVVPVAVNTGLYWPRRGFVKRPGRAVIEFLEPIEPGLDRRAFLDALSRRLEPACDALLQETQDAPDGDPGSGPACG